MKHSTHHNFVIIGGGPGGIQLGYYLHKAQADYLILERSAVPASTFQVMPRHRKLISINKLYTGCSNPEFNMRHDWNSLLCEDDDFRFGNYDKQFFPDADSLVRYMRDFVERYAIRMQYDTEVMRIEKSATGYRIIDASGNSITCEVLIIATGVARPNVPRIEGIEHADNYADMSLDVTEYENKRILIIGKKNSAFETADHLVGVAAMIHLISPNSIRMAWKSHYVGDLRAVNNNLLDTYQLKSQNAVLDAEIESISAYGDQFKVAVRYAHAEGEVEEIVYDRVICCAGFKFDASMFADNAAPELAYNGKYPALTPSFESTNNPGMYFAGTLTHSLDYRKATSGFIHGFRYNSRALAGLLLDKYLGLEIPYEMLPREAEALTVRMLERVNHSGGLWQQPGFIADVAIDTEDGLKYIRELPKDYLVRNYDGEFYVLTLEYGAPIVGDPFAVERIHRENVTQAQESQFLHPVIRHYVNGEFVSKHEVIEDLEANWAEPEHYEPMFSYFNVRLHGGTADEAESLIAASTA